MRYTNVLIMTAVGCFLVLPIGCAPEGPSARVEVPAAKNAANPERTIYHYDHKVDTGMDPKERAAMKSELVIAVGRIGDTKDLGTPFGSVEKSSSIKSELTITVGNVGNTKDLGATSGSVEKGSSIRATPVRQGMYPQARNEIAVQLQQTGMFTVVERAEVVEMVRELAFSEGKWVNAKTAAPVGNLYGVRYFVTGQVIRNALAPKQGITKDNWDQPEKVEPPYTCQLRVIKVETGEIVVTAQAKGKTMREARKDAVNQLTGGLAVYWKQQRRPSR
jgi:hypothetical protein